MNRTGLPMTDHCEYDPHETACEELQLSFDRYRQDPSAHNLELVQVLMARVCRRSPRMVPEFGEEG